MSVSLIDGHIDDDVLTDEQIIKALEYCVEKGYCTDCPYNESFSDCKVEYDILNLINRQKAEIEGLKEECSYLGCENEWLKAHLEQAKSEAVKEFAKKLKKNKYYGCNRLGYGSWVVEISDIDNLAKEKVGEG
jgi:hypothetical protein